MPRHSDHRRNFPKCCPILTILSLLVSGFKPCKWLTVLNEILKVIQGWIITVIVGKETRSLYPIYDPNSEPPLSKCDRYSRV